MFYSFFCIQMIEKISCTNKKTSEGVSKSHRKKTKVLCGYEISLGVFCQTPKFPEKLFCPYHVKKFNREKKLCSSLPTLASFPGYTPALSEGPTAQPLGLLTPGEGPEAQRRHVLAEYFDIDIEDANEIASQGMKLKQRYLKMMGNRSGRPSKGHEGVVRRITRRDSYIIPKAVYYTLLLASKNLEGSLQQYLRDEAEVSCELKRQQEIVAAFRDKNGFCYQRVLRYFNKEFMEEPSFFSTKPGFCEDWKAVQNKFAPLSEEASERVLEELEELSDSSEGPPELLEADENEKALMMGCFTKTAEEAKEEEKEVELVNSIDLSLPSLEEAFVRASTLSDGSLTREELEKAGNMFMLNFVDYPECFKKIGAEYLMVLALSAYSQAKKKGKPTGKTHQKGKVKLNLSMIEVKRTKLAMLKLNCELCLAMILNSIARANEAKGYLDPVMMNGIKHFVGGVETTMSIDLIELKHRKLCARIFGFIGAQLDALTQVINIKSHECGLICENTFQHIEKCSRRFKFGWWDYCPRSSIKTLNQISMYGILINLIVLLLQLKPLIIINK
eukprot:TRINITY_DN3879_c0_g1_i4.p1 TRINITY_DN3879_c0_g1~~TRINITY_DN3879_c0_g1_i4.p1  ORF type:complete len:559 (+),score=36.07 TRINITY_DN3879_c0_g1_i4:2378-4054(+)